MTEEQAAEILLILQAMEQNGLSVSNSVNLLHDGILMLVGCLTGIALVIGVTTWRT